ncbi:MAG: hypothetical protein WC472_04095 [Candidatus Paceibacterota bacterium]
MNLVHSKNEQGSVTIDTGIDSHNIPSNEQKIGRCCICGKKDIPITIRRIYKEIVFGSYKKESVDLVCSECRHLMNHSIRMMENEILQKFAPTYELIWKNFILRKHFPQNTLESFVEDQIKKIRISSSAISPEIDDQCYEEEKEIIGTCPCCNKKRVKLTKHHPLRKKVFGPNNEIVFLCRDCHDLVEKVVTRFERIVLRKFSRCYRGVWKAYTNNGVISDIEARELARYFFSDLMARKGLLSTEVEISENAVAIEAN